MYAPPGAGPEYKLHLFRSPLLGLRWHRVVLDEAQEVQYFKKIPSAGDRRPFLDSLPRAWKRAEGSDEMREVFSRLHRRNSWCISGTPLENSAAWVQVLVVRGETGGRRRAMVCTQPMLTT